jgi:hypothetical protein
MGNASGVLLIVTGMGVAGYMLAIEPHAGKEPKADSLRVASMVPVKPAAGTHAPLPAAKPQPTALPARTAPAAASTGPVVVDLTHRAEPRPVVPLKSALPASDEAAITRELQKELRRVGCYDGPLTGVWTPSVREAMKEFTERVNATLPLGRPDLVLLALVQGHGDKVCDKSCPSGQASGQDGRCVPAALLARGSHKATSVAAAAPAQTISGWSTMTTAAPPAPLVPSPSPPAGRMALAGPSLGAPPAAGAVTGYVPEARGRRVAAPRPAVRQERVRSGYAQRSGWGRPTNFADSVFRNRLSTY